MNNIRLLRKKKDLKVPYLADLLGITPKHFYDLETGNRRLNEKHIRALTEIFNVTSDELLGSDPVHESDVETTQPKDLAKFLNQAEVMFDGELYDLDDTDRETLRKALEFAFWQAKQKNKRK